MKRPILITSSLVLASIGAAAIYFLYSPSPAVPSGEVERRKISLGGHERHYTVYTPPTANAGASILLAFHPSRSNGQQMRGYVGAIFERIAERENLIVVYPDGVEGHFNDCRRMASYSARTLNIDDVGFAKAIVGQLVKDRKANSYEVYAVGYSNGAQMALRLAMETRNFLKGLIAISANLPARENMDCQLAVGTTRSLVFVEGTEDPVNPYGGGQVTLFGFGNRGSVLSAQGTAEWFASARELVASESTSLRERDGIVASQQDWSSPSGRVRLVTVKGGGHTVPQSNYRFPRILGQTYMGDEILDSAWKFIRE